MHLVIDEVLEPEEFDGTEIAPIVPEDVDLHFPTSVQVERVPEVPTRLTHRLPSRLSGNGVV